MSVQTTIEKRAAPAMFDRKVPGPNGLPFVGVGMSFLKSPTDYLEKMVEKYGRVFSLPLGGNEFVFLNDAEHIEQVLRLDFKNFGMSPTSENLLRPLLGRSMPVVTDHLYWEQLHSIMLPMFTPKMLQKYFLGTRDAIVQEIEQLAELKDSDRPLQMYQFARQSVFSGLARTLFVRGIGADEIPRLLELFDRSNNYMNARNLSGASPLVLAMPSVRDGKNSLKKIDARVCELIEFRKANRVKEPEDMLDVLLAAELSNGEPLSDQALRDNVMALLFGGQETTPGAITWAFGLLASHPEKREKMFAEIDSVLGGELPTYQHLSQLKYTDHVLDEAMRLYPAFTFIGRESLVETEIGGYPIKKGQQLGFVAWTVHRDERFWEDPDKFIPERHEKERRKDRAKCAFLSFGYGQRRCIGERVGRMEALLTLVLVSQKYLLEHQSGQLPQHKVLMSIKPVDGMPMLVKSKT